MSLFRPEALAALRPWREAAAAAAVAALGLRIAAEGGLILVPLGLAVAALGAGWGLYALRRLRFAQDVAAPGVVEVNEGQIAYMGPAFGGYAALPDLVEIRLMTMRGRRLWRLRQTDGEVLLIPVDAAGAERLFDAFAALPGMDTGALVAALNGGAAGGRAAAGTALAAGPQMQTVWRRAGTGLAPT
ncbi:MAG: hypothetical protein KF887_18155 [Paracoccaceae bacterium]|nr:MAG: hypothetical protein KF887_18155 [Paracoccaceae bacterium]